MASTNAKYLKNRGKAFLNQNESANQFTKKSSPKEIPSFSAKK